MPYKVPPSIGIDQESLPQPNESTTVGELHYFAPRCQENQVERATFPHCDPHYFKDDDGELLELYAVKKHFKVEMEGDPDYFFDEVTKDDTEQPEEEVLPQVIDDE